MEVSFEKKNTDKNSNREICTHPLIVGVCMFASTARAQSNFANSEGGGGAAVEPYPIGVRTAKYFDVPASAHGPETQKYLNSSIAYTGSRGLACVLDTTIEEKKKREDLKAKRDLLFERYVKRPMDAHLALEIKVLDDELAENTKPSTAKYRSSFRGRRK